MLYECPTSLILATINEALLVNRHPDHNIFIQSSSIKSLDRESSLSDQSNDLILLRPVKVNHQ